MSRSVTGLPWIISTREASYGLKREVEIYRPGGPPASAHAAVRLHGVYAAGGAEPSATVVDRINQQAAVERPRSKADGDRDDARTSAMTGPRSSIQKSALFDGR